MSQDGKIAQAAQKVRYALIPMQATKGLARVFAYGAKKYQPGNWYEATLSDGAAERYQSAVDRHKAAMQEPNGLWTPESLSKLDEESGLPHIDHLLASVVMLRGILIKDGVLPADPGEGNEPPKMPGKKGDS